MPFPTRAPELNPIELFGNIHVERLVNVNADSFVVGDNLNLKNTASHILNLFSHDDVEQIFVRCGS